MRKKFHAQFFRFNLQLEIKIASFEHASAIDRCNPLDYSGRLIYYFHSEQLPLYLLTVFGKNEKANLTMDERKELSKLAKALSKLAKKGLENG